MSDEGTEVICVERYTAQQSNDGYEWVSRYVAERLEDGMDNHLKLLKDGIRRVRTKREVIEHRTTHIYQVPPDNTFYVKLNDYEITHALNSIVTIGEMI